MIKAEPLSYALGAELTSIDMRETLGEQDIRLIQETWHVATRRQKKICIRLKLYKRSTSRKNK